MDILNLIVGAERAENWMERNAAVSGRYRKIMERSAEQEVAERENGGYRNRLERGAAFSLRSHALISTHDLRVYHSASDNTRLRISDI